MNKNVQTLVLGVTNLKSNHFETPGIHAFQQKFK